MATSKRETIIDAVTTKLATISVANSYEQNVAVVYRPAVEPEQFPCVLVSDMGDEVRWHLRGAYENIINLDLIAHVEKGYPADRQEALSDLVADIVKACMADETWSSNARQTWIAGIANIEDSPAMPRMGRAVVSLRIQYRTAWADPYTTKAI
jgi:hypothetical protein